MARWTGLVMLIKNKYTLCGRKRFLLPVIYFSPNTIYRFTLRVTVPVRMNTKLQINFPFDISLLNFWAWNTSSTLLLSTNCLIFSLRFVNGSITRAGKLFTMNLAAWVRMPTKERSGCLTMTPQ